MDNRKKTSGHRFYRGKYFIAFYDKTGEKYLHSFDNVREILKFQGKPITTTNINLVNVELCRAFRGSGIVKFLTGAPMRVYLIDLTSDD